MHTGQMDDGEGEFRDWRACDRKCRECGGGPVRFRVWDSSCGGYEDEQYRCEACGATWWVDGPDA